MVRLLLESAMGVEQAASKAPTATSAVRASEDVRIMESVPLSGACMGFSADVRGHEKASLMPCQAAGTAAFLVQYAAAGVSTFTSPSSNESAAGTLVADSALLNCL
jgi:hypothetical protein